MWRRNLVLGLSSWAMCWVALIVVTPHPPEIATVDIVGITEQFIKQQASQNSSTQEKQQAIKVFSHQLEHALDTLSRSKSLILVPKEAVLKGAKDYTSVLQNLIHAQENL